MTVRPWSWNNPGVFVTIQGLRDQTPGARFPWLLMGVFGSGFGPDTSTGLLPQPHLLLQAWVREWDVPAILKLLFVCAVVAGFLLITYHTMVRHTWLGRLLNGPRTRRRPAIESLHGTEPGIA